MHKYHGPLPHNGTKEQILYFPGCYVCALSEILVFCYFFMEVDGIWSWCFCYSFVEVDGIWSWWWALSIATREYLWPAEHADWHLWSITDYISGLSALLHNSQVWGTACWVRDMAATCECMKTTYSVFFVCSAMNFLKSIWFMGEHHIKWYDVTICILIAGTAFCSVHQLALTTIFRKKDDLRMLVRPLFLLFLQMLHRY